MCHRCYILLLSVCAVHLLTVLQMIKSSMLSERAATTKTIVLIKRVPFKAIFTFHSPATRQMLTFAHRTKYKCPPPSAFLFVQPKLNAKMISMPFIVLKILTKGKCSHSVDALHLPLLFLTCTFVSPLPGLTPSVTSSRIVILYSIFALSVLLCVHFSHCVQTVRLSSPAPMPIVVLSVKNTCSLSTVALLSAAEFIQ